MKLPENNSTRWIHDEHSEGENQQNKEKNVLAVNDMTE